MEKIEVGYRELGEVFGIGIYHQFILYTDKSGTQYATSGWMNPVTGKITTTYTKRVSFNLI